MSMTVVAGGGIAGLVAAMMLARRGRRVVLVERDAWCGGLLGSIQDDAGTSFDHGAHVLSETGDASVDALLAEGLDENWRPFRILRAGNWFAGRMNKTSPFPDARALGGQVASRGLSEIDEIHGAQHAAEPSNLQQALRRRFGTTLATNVAGPVVRKQLGVDLEELHPDTPFALRRIVCADAASSRRLKEAPQYSDVLAFESYEEGVGSLNHWYPRSGGIGQWVDRFVDRLRLEGVEIVCGRTIANIEHMDGMIRSVTLDDGQVVECHLLAWTLPSAMLLRAAGIPFSGKPPLSRPIGLFHLVFDRPFLDPNYHVTCYDEEFHTFRVTLYPNLRDDSGNGPFNCTVEVIGNSETSFESLLPLVVAELCTLGITSPDSTVLRHLIRIVPIGFPATTMDFMAANARQTETAAASLRNALLIGRARCPPFFTVDVLREAASTIHAATAS